MKKVLKVAGVLAMAMGLALGLAEATVIPEKVLQDGRKVVIENGKLYVFPACVDGGAFEPNKPGDKAGRGALDCSKAQRTLAKDGVYTLQDGQKLVVKGGRVVVENPTKK